VGNYHEERSFPPAAPASDGNGMKRRLPHPPVEACIRAMYISYRMDSCGRAAAGPPHKDVGAACGNS